MTDRERAIITAYTGKSLMGHIGVFEFRTYLQGLKCPNVRIDDPTKDFENEELHELSKQDFIGLCEGNSITDDEKAVISAYTGYAMLTGEKWDYFQSYLEKLAERPIWTHELGSNDKLLDDLTSKAKIEYDKMRSK